MLHTMKWELSERRKKSKLMEQLQEKHPLVGGLMFQLAAGILLITAVSGIAFAGGAIIWMFYRIVGVM